MSSMKRPFNVVLNMNYEYAQKFALLKEASDKKFGQHFP
jgi:hypothetical protein